MFTCKQNEYLNSVVNTLFYLVSDIIILVQFCCHLKISVEMVVGHINRMKM